MRRSALVLTAALVLAADPVRATEMLLDGIAAQVGPDIVLVSEVMAMIFPMETEMRRQSAPESEIMKLRADGLERMIEWRLIEQVVRQSDLYATDDQIDGAIGAIAQETGLTMDQMQESVESHGLSWSGYRIQIQRELERRNVISSMVAPRIRVGDEEIESRYREIFSEQPTEGAEVHLRQVLVAAGGETSRSLPFACTAARTARARVEEGEAFEVVASEVSDVEPARGGDIGWLLEKTLAGWMAELASGLDSGETSDVVELPFGCTFLQLVERRDYEFVTLEMAYNQIQAQLYDEKITQEFKDFLEKLREHTFIERKGYFAGAAHFGQRTFAVPDESAEEAPVP